MAKRLFIPCDECGFEEFWQTNFCTQCGSPIPQRTADDLPPLLPRFNWVAFGIAIISTTSLLLLMTIAIEYVDKPLRPMIFYGVGSFIILACAFVTEMLFPHDERFEVSLGIALSIVVAHIASAGKNDIMQLALSWQLPFLIALLGSSIGRWMSRRRNQSSDRDTKEENDGNHTQTA
jgi:hypothetical protein